MAFSQARSTVLPMRIFLNLVWIIAASFTSQAWAYGDFGTKRSEPSLKFSSLLKPGLPFSRCFVPGKRWPQSRPGRTT